jgi:hypothetical protein
MERVRKTFFNPLATSKAQVQKILEDLPVGSAHPFSLEQILLCRTENGIEEIDISSYPENFFFNAMDLGEMGEILLRRMAGFQYHLSMCSLSNEYMDGEVNINNVQRYSRTSKLCKHQHQHLRSLSSQIKLPFSQFLNEHPLTTTSASRMNRVTHAAGLQEIPSRESPTAEIFSMDRISSIMSRSTRTLSQRKKSACSSPDTSLHSSHGS